MFLSEIFEYLNYGELANLSIGNETEAGIPEESYPAIVSHLNLALIALYTEFPLRENSAIIQMYDTITQYRLHTDYASTSASAEPVKYITDTVADPFLGRVLKIHKVVSSDTEVGIVLNYIDAEENLVTTINHNTLEVPVPDASHTLTVTYREGPEKINAASLDPSTVEIPLPETLIEPLLYFIAARAHMRTPALEGQPTLMMQYMQKYDRAINVLQDNGAIQNHAVVNHKLDTNGWV